jgi:hypothetical protein
MKGSGYGRTHGVEGLRACTATTYVDADAGRLPVPWWFPYGPRSLDGFRGALGLLYERGAVPRAAAVWRHRRGLVHLAGRYLGR